MAEFSQVRAFNLGIAQQVSVEGALIYDDLIYAQKNFGEGWFYRSYDMLLKRFPMYSEQTIRRHIKKLEEAGWISTKVMKVNGKPTCHFQIGRFLSTKLAETIETTKLADSINNNTKTTQNADASSNSSFGDNSNSAPAAAELLPRLIMIINPKEKPTKDRIVKLNARLKDYTETEIIQSANAFSKSDWHKENKQMSIDNLLAPSKFGRWYAQRSETAAASIAETEEERQKRIMDRMK